MRRWESYLPKAIQSIGGAIAITGGYLFFNTFAGV
jgi:hypothetical protein